MRSPAFAPVAVLVIVYVRVWVVPMSTSPGAAGAVCAMVNVLAACAGMLMAARAISRARKPQRFMLPSRILATQFSRLDRSRRRNFRALSARKNPVHRALRASDGPRRHELRLVVLAEIADQHGRHRSQCGVRCGRIARRACHIIETARDHSQRHDASGAAEILVTDYFAFYIERAGAEKLGMRNDLHVCRSRAIRGQRDAQRRHGVDRGTAISRPRRPRMGRGSTDGYVT